MARKQPALCTNDPAHGKPYARGLCEACYTRLRRSNPELMRRRGVAGSPELREEMDRVRRDRELLSAWRPTR